MQVESYLSTITHPGGHIQSMEVGAQQCVQLSNAFFDGDGLYHRNSFQRPVGDFSVSQGPFTDRGHFYLPFKMVLERK